MEVDVTTEPSPVADLNSFTPEQRMEWRKTGAVPKTEEPAPSQDPSAVAKEEPEAAENDAPAPEADKQTQEKVKPRSNAQDRIRELLAENKRLSAQLKERPETKAEPSPAKPEARQEFTRVKPTQNDMDSEGKQKYASYEDYMEDLVDWKAEQKLAKFQVEQRQAAQQKQLQEKLNEARKRYPDLEKVIQPVATQVFSDQNISPVVKALVDDSPVLPDLLYVLGSNEAELNEFLETARTNPGAAIRKVVLLEKLVSEELAKETSRDDSGKFVAKPKEPTPDKKITDALPPPREVGGKGTAPTDELESAVKNDDFNSFKAAANRRDLTRRKG